MAELIEKVNEILQKANYPERHTFFQIEKFIIGKEPTSQAQLWAIVRELEVRKETLENYEKDLKDAEDTIELFDVQVERLDWRIKKLSEKKGELVALNIRECEINIRKIERQKDALIKSAQKVNKKFKAIQEEMDFLIKGYEKITEHYGPILSVDDEQAQKEMWNERLLEEFNLRLILQRPFEPEFVKTVMQLHDEAPVKQQVTKLLQSMQNKMIEERKTLTKRPAVEVAPKITGK
jgi:hypothetical protein